MIRNSQINPITLYDSGAVSRLDQIFAKKLIQTNGIFAAAPMTINELINTSLGNENIKKYDFKLVLDWLEIIIYEIRKLNNDEMVSEFSNFPLKNGKHQIIPLPNKSEIQNHNKIKEDLWSEISESKQIEKITINRIDTAEDEQWWDFHRGDFDNPPHRFMLSLQNEIIKFGPKIIKESCPSFRGLIRVLALLSLIKKIKGQTTNSSVNIVDIGVIKINKNLLPDFQIMAGCPYVNKFVSLDEGQTNFAKVVFPEFMFNIQYIPQVHL